MANKKDVMGYIAPADTQPLLDLLGGSKQLLKKFQGLLGLQLAGPSARHQGDNNSLRFAKLLALFSYTSSSGSEIEAAFVRWLVAKRPAVKDKKHAKNLTLVQLKWEEEKGRNSSADIVELSSILGPCYVQPIPTKSDTIYFNQWVGSTL
ncbi:TPA: hypothetical protein ACH3X1_015421 [Trebouxia sp. C0004]